MRLREFECDAEWSAARGKGLSGRGSLSGGGDHGLDERRQVRVVLEDVPDVDPDVELLLDPRGEPDGGDGLATQLEECGVLLPARHGEHVPPDLLDLLRDVAAHCFLQGAPKDSPLHPEFTRGGRHLMLCWMPIRRT